MIKGRADTYLFRSLLLIGVPALIGLFFLFFSSHLLNTDNERFTRVEKAERWIQPLPNVNFDTENFRVLSATAPNFESAIWTPVSLPDTEVLPVISMSKNDPPVAMAWVRFYVVRSNQVLSDVKSGSLGLYGTRIMGGAYTVWVNGKKIYSNTDDWRMQWNKPLLINLNSIGTPIDQPIEVIVGVPFKLSQGYAFGSMYIASERVAQKLHDLRYFIQQTLPRGGILVTLLLGFFSLHFWLGRRSETPHLLLALASVAWFVCDLQYFIDYDNAIVSRWFGALVDSALSWAILLSFLFAFRIADVEFPRMEKCVISYFLISTLVTLPVWNWWVSALVLQHYGNLVVGFGFACLYSVVAIRDSRLNVKVVAISLWSIVILGAHDLFLLTSQRYPDSFHFFPYSPFLLFGAFMFSIQKRYFIAIRSVEEMNLSLNQRLLERERELGLKHNELLEFEKRQAALLEQQRLMREMHDGIGSALITTLYLVERGNLPFEQVEAILRECVDELRLVIDSIEPFDQDLVAMLASVRDRMGQKIERAGVNINWEVSELPPLKWLDQNHILNILRILQEALTNILKHSGASEIHVYTSHAYSGKGSRNLIIYICDNGVGFDMQGDENGRGLKNMKKRATDIHGDLQIISNTGSGTMIQLLLPCELEAG